MSTRICAAKAVTVAKALLFPSSVGSLGPFDHNLSPGEETGFRNRLVLPSGP
jgi:hypothetical protein